MHPSLPTTNTNTKPRSRPLPLPPSKSAPATPTDTTRPAPPFTRTLSSSAPPSPSTSTPNTMRPSRSFLDLLDSTTLQIGFDSTCLEGLTDDLLYSPVDAFAQLCWDTCTRTPSPSLPSMLVYPWNSCPELEARVSVSPYIDGTAYHQLFQTQDQASGSALPTSDPGVYRIPKRSRSQTTIRAQLGDVNNDRHDQESYLQLSDADEDEDEIIEVSRTDRPETWISSMYESGACFWDDSDDGAEEAEEYYDNDTSSGDEDSDDISLRFSRRPEEHYPVIDAKLGVDDMVSPRPTSFISWEATLPGEHMGVQVALDLTKTRSKESAASQKKKPNRIAALTANFKIPPLRISGRRAPTNNTWL